LGSLSEPRRKQNLYANPKRTAKFSINRLSDAPRAKKVQTIFKKLLRNFARQPPLQPTAQSYTINRLVTN
jgi:hypothetical protein